MTSFVVTGSDILLSGSTVSNNNNGNLNLEAPLGQAVRIIIDGDAVLQVDSRTVTILEGDLSVGRNAIISSDLTVVGNLNVDGITSCVTRSMLNVEDSHMDIGRGYATSDVARESGIVMNYLPTSISDSVGMGGFTAGVHSITNHQVMTTSEDVFAENDIIQISGASDERNNGFFEVESHVGHVLMCRGIGANPPSHNLFKDDFVTDSSHAGIILKVTIGVFQISSSGKFQHAHGCVTPLIFVPGGGVFEYPSYSMYNVIQEGEAASLTSENRYNFVQGFGAATNLAGGNHNIVIGSSAFSGVVKGANQNIAIGRNALVGSAGTSGQNNVCVGDHSGSTITSGQNNVCVGSSTGVDIGSRYGAVAIGNGIKTANADESFSCIHRSIVSGSNASFTNNELHSDTSSIRCMRDIHPYEADLSLFDQLKSVVFKAKKEYAHPDHPDADFVGMIAEDLLDIYPEFVVHEHENLHDMSSPMVPNSIAYDSFVILLIEKIKELDKRIVTLENLVK
jgi:hypothetical protein